MGQWYHDTPFLSYIVFSELDWEAETMSFAVQFKLNKLSFINRRFTVEEHYTLNNSITHITSQDQNYKVKEMKFTLNL